MMDKKIAYDNLVKEVAACTLCDAFTTTKNNQSVCLTHDPDRRNINLWAEWQNSLDAKILLIGQDWGELKNTDLARSLEKEIDAGISYRDTDASKSSPTDNNLCNLFQEALDIKTRKKNEMLFFTNSVQCYKTGNLDNPTSTRWFSNCNEKYVCRLIDIIRPKVVIVMGQSALKGLVPYGTPKDLKGNALDKGYFNESKFSNILNSGPFLFELMNGFTTTVCPVSHTSPQATNINRNAAQQLADWKRIAEHLK